MHPPLLSTPLRTCPSKLATTLSYPEGNPTKSQPAVKRANSALQNALVPFGSRPHRRAVWWPWWLSGKESACQFRRCRFNPWVGKIPRRRKWQSTLVFLPGESDGQRSLEGYSPCGCKSWTGLSKQQQQISWHIPGSSYQKSLPSVKGGSTQIIHSIK